MKKSTKISGFNAGQFGDLVLNTVAARSLKETRDDVFLSLGIAKKYAALAPLFFNHKYIDGIHVWEGYDDWPTPNDKEIINDFDIVFNAMPPHYQNDNNWFTKRHQAAETCLMNGLPVPEDLSCNLEVWFDIQTYEKTIAFAPFAGWYNPNNDKKLTTEIAQKLVDAINKLGYSVLQLGGQNEPCLKNVYRPNSSIFDAVRAMLGCKLLIHTDTFMGWAASAYKFPQLGLYSNKYYIRNGENYIKNIQPVNPNAQYLDADNANNLNLDLIVERIKSFGL